jgi:hypothetical protein
MRRGWRAICFPGVVTFAWGLGCGPADEFQHVGVSGKVALDGKPLPSGTITFVPLGAGAASHGPITDGSYAIARSAGPSPGSFRVEISSVRPTGRQVPDSEYPGKTVEETRNAVPQRYNVNSELRAEIKRDQDAHFDWEIATKTSK